MDNNLFGFNSDFEADTGESFLVLSKEGFNRKQITEFQVEMMVNNRIPGVVTLDVREKDSVLRLYYNLSGLVSLANYLKRQKISKVEFLTLLDRLVSTLMEGRRYFLDDTSFTLDENYIYINPKTREVSLIYIPVDFVRDTIQSLQAFIINLVINTANIDTRDNFVQLLLKQIKVEEFNLPDFRRWLIDMISSDKDYIPQISEPAPVPSPIKPGPALEASPVRPPTRPPETADRILAGKAQLPERPDKDKGNRDNQSLVPAKFRKSNIRKIILSILAVMSVSAAIISNTGYSFGGLRFQVNRLFPVLAACIVIGMGLVLAVSYFTGTGERNAAADKPEKNKPGTSKVDVPSFEAAEQAEYPAFIEKVKAMPLDAGFDETVLLGEGGGPLLKAVHSDETILITKPGFTLGRNRETCDYTIENKGIGRAHAQIEKGKDAYYIKDLDSQNGTFLNGLRLLSNKEYQLNDSDRIAFANAEYYFKLH